jgi:phosphatidylserine decarboxylase
MLRRILLTALPKVLLSRLCGWLCRMPLPHRARAPFYRWFANRYRAALAEAAEPLEHYRSLQEFFRRALVPGARPLGNGPLLWPCDGRIVTVGPVRDGRIEQVKGQDYALADLLGDAELAAALDGGQQATIYLAPGDYHRVHAPFDGDLEAVLPLPGTLFPVNPPAVRCIPRLFAHHSRHVYRCRTTSGHAAAVVLVGAYNVGDTLVSKSKGAVHKGDELGQFGFGSTVVVVLAKGAARFREVSSETAVRMGAAAADA